MATALVTGATGFVGSYVVEALLARGYRVWVTVRRKSPPQWFQGRAVEKIEVDFSRDVSLPACDLFFHVAGLIRADSYRRYLATNRDVAVRAFEAARARRFLLVSSLAAAGPGSVDEATPCRPISLYGKSKWEGEQEVWKRRDRVPVTIVRPPVVYGPRDMGLLDMYRAVAHGVRPEIGGRKLVSMVHARDLAEGIVRAAEAPEGAGEVFYLANREAWAMSGLLDLIERAIGRRAFRVPIPDRVVRLLGAVAEDASRAAGIRSMFCRDKALEMTQAAWVCSPEKARRLLGWEAKVPVPEGMAEALRWYREQGLL
jgi:nucleoside-diphosphate-sugar epimerase